MKILEAAFAGAGDFSGFEDGHEGVQGLKGHGETQVEALDGQGEREMGLTHAGRAKEANVKCLLYLVLYPVRNQTRSWAGFPHGYVIALGRRQPAYVLCLVLQKSRAKSESDF